MIPYIVITVIGVGATLLLTGDDEPPAPPAPVVEEQPSIQPLSDALFWMGGCSVACSLIWGTCIIYTAKIKRKDYRGNYN